MPGRCKFQDAWLAKDIYKDWLVKDPQDIQLARCRACCKAIKLQTMGEAALTSHAVGTGHKAAVRKLVEGKQSTNPPSPDSTPAVFKSVTWCVTKKPAAPKTKRRLSNNETQDAAAAAAAAARGQNGPRQRNIVVMNVGDHVNGYGGIKDEDDKEQVALILNLNSFDRMTGSDPPAALDHGAVGTSAAAHNAAFQEVAFPTSYIDSCGVPSLSSVDCGVPRAPPHNNTNNNPPPRLLLHPPQQPPPHHHHPPSPAPRRRREEPGRDAAAPPPPPPATPPRAPRPAAAALARRERERRERSEATEKEKEERVETLGEQQERQAGRREQMESLEWERRMRVLAWEQEVLREKGRAARQKARAYRMKRRYYGAKLKRMGQDVPPPSSSSSGSDEDEWGSGEHAPKEESVV